MAEAGQAASAIVSEVKPPPAEAQPTGTLRVELASFGYSHGVPHDVDSSRVYDVRALPNPRSHRAYKHLTGEDKALQRQILDSERGQLAYKRFDAWLDAHMTRARLGGLTLLRLFVGCKSGQHRSVSIVCRCGEMRAGDSSQAVEVSHRDRAHWVTTALMVKCELCQCEVHRNAWDNHISGKKHLRLAEATAAKVEAPQQKAVEGGKKPKKERHRKRQRLAQEETSDRRGDGPACADAKPAATGKPDDATANPPPAGPCEDPSRVHTLQRE